jgi:alcohol dehydrogenase class IV
MRFEFATAARIIFGPGTAGEVAPAAREMGRRALLVTGRGTERAGALTRSLTASSLECVPFAAAGEPTVDLVRLGARTARRERCDLVIAFGGGSPIDAGKAIAALAANDGDVLDYLEVVGRGQALGRPPLPFIAVPTTAGTGSEVTRNAVLASPEHRVKASLRSPLMLPRLAVVDPELTYDLPPRITASTGLDALTQLIEPYVSLRANPMIDALCLEGIRRASRSLARAYHNGSDREARLDMSLASLFGGLALANAGLGAVHGFAAAIGGAFDAPHGAVCAALLPSVMEMNIRALRARAPRSAALVRYEEIARVITGSASASAEAGAKSVGELCEELQIPPLAAYGAGPQHVGALVEAASRASSMKANPIALTPEELREILAGSLRTSLPDR